MDKLNDPRHDEIRSALRAIGPALAAIGLIFVVIGLGNFFLAFGGSGPPRFFWCAFVGMPLLFVGGAVTKFAYFGAVARYLAGEAAPVGKDVANYMVDGARDSIRDVATAVGQGFAAGYNLPATRCTKCGADNDGSAKFCNQCGSPLAEPKHCAKCGGDNDYDARYCGHCGTPISA